ncbi:STX8 isoform 6 [Pan troglodytes]|uniref:Syntaxin 8 n=3 Tax=Hominidae TaxID=9604 RepID=K7ER37_HUMAN|nr:STX8 isoform 6 [Pan troglodytes]PNJ31749.1 STX8 isoform 6 [Pongo abelii]
MAPDPWFSTYDSTCQIAQEIAEKIQQRNQYERKGEKAPKNRTQALMPFPLS